MKTAYTIGNQKNYLEALDDFRKRGEPLTKLGRDDDGYSGGIVWKTPEEAQQYIDTTELPFEAAVFEIALVTGWDDAVWQPVGADDRAHYLIHDAEILRHVPASGGVCVVDSEP